MYHYIKDYTNPLYCRLKGLDAELFDKQLSFFEKNFNVIRMEDIIEFYLSGGKANIPEKAILLTFDDGSKCHYTCAFPLLKKHNMHGSFFIPARVLHENKLLNTNKIHLILAYAQIDEVYNEILSLLKKSVLSADSLYEKYVTMNRWDDAKTAFCKVILQNIEPIEYRNELINLLYEKFINIDESIIAKEFYLNKNQIKEMQDSGMFIGIHGYLHSRLGYMDSEHIKEDIDRAIDIMKDFINVNCWVMSYPYGHSSSEVIKYISRKGACMAITTEPKIANLSYSDRYLLPRLDCNDFPPKSEEYINAEVRKDK